MNANKKTSEIIRFYNNYHENHREILMLHDKLVDSCYNCFYGSIRMALVSALCVFLFGFHENIISESFRLIAAVGFGFFLMSALYDRDEIYKHKLNRETYIDDHAKDAKVLEEDYKKFLSALDKMDEKSKK